MLNKVGKYLTKDQNQSNNSTKLSKEPTLFSGTVKLEFYSFLTFNKEVKEF